MDTQFQTSFIPKKPLVTDGSNISKGRPSGKASLFMILGVIIFIASIAGAVFSVVWKSVLLSAQEQYKIDLNKNKESFNIPLIEELKKASAKLELTKNILKSHIAVSEVFNIIGALTIEGVKYSGMTYTGPSGTGDIGSLAIVSLKGVATSFSSVAFQSDVFGQSGRFGKNKVIKNPLLSNLAADDNGDVTFDFSANIDPADINYQKVYTDTLKSEGLIPNTTNNNTNQ